jgi:hypothetical protein
MTHQPLRAFCGDFIYHLPPSYVRGETFVTKFTPLAAAAVLAAIAATPAIGQQVIYNPGYCAQF